VTAIQRFGGGLNLNIHFRTLLFDGVFYAAGAGDTLDFRPLPPRRTPRSASCSRGSPRGCSGCSSAGGLDPGDADRPRLIPWLKHLRFWLPSAAPRFRGASRSVLARARACGAWGTIPTRRGCSRRPPGTRILWASTCTPTSPSRPQTARAWNSSAVICSARPSPRTGLRLLDDGRIVLMLKTAWVDGTRARVRAPGVARATRRAHATASDQPRPLHGVLAPHTAWRARVVAYGAPAVRSASGHKPRRCAQRLSAIRSPRASRLIRSPLGACPSQVTPLLCAAEIP
jgi:hypothetical protein